MSQFADLSEFGYGVAILSESKYGFSCQGNVLRISLLRSATAPDAEQDQGSCPCLSWLDGHIDTGVCQASMSSRGQLWPIRDTSLSRMCLWLRSCSIVLFIVSS